MDFLNDHLTLAQPNKVSFSFNGLKLPNNTDIYFRAKQKEIVEQYSAARLFLQETECKDWDHWFIPHNDDKINEAFKLMLKSYFYEAALMYYNILVDLSWTICYLSVEFSMQVEGKRIDFDGLKSIEEATALLGEIFGGNQNFCRHTDPPLSNSGAVIANGPFQRQNIMLPKSGWGPHNARQPPYFLAVQQLIAELGVDMCLQGTLVRVEMIHAADQPNRQILVHIIVLQVGRPHQRPVAADYLVDDRQVLFHNAVAFRNRIVMFHDAFLSVPGVQKRQ